MKIIAMYLPQYHRVKENDEWWGEGYTDWVAVKNAESLFDGHDQPRLPLNANYYDLTDKDSMIWQSKLMHEYGIDGMCIYHYWFKDGRQILEKPAELLLEWKDVDMPFCFSWANETWARTWSGIRTSNHWADKYEQTSSGELVNSNGILLEQEYGSEKEWKDHFKYLQPFFRDERYIKVDGKPLFVIHNVEDISCLRKMIDCWNRLAYEAGFKGMFILGGGCRQEMTNVLDGQIYRYPRRALARIKKDKINGINVVEGQNAWDSLLEEPQEYNTIPYFMGFSGYDDTPRRGGKGTVITRVSPDRYERNIYELLKKNSRHGANFTFINAWNEWGEGMYLEPDEIDKYQYLQAIKNAKDQFESEECQFDKTLQVLGGKYTNLSILNKRTEANLRVLDRWLNLSEEGVNVGKNIADKYGDVVAVYGFGVLGRHLVRCLKSANVRIEYVVEKNVTVKNKYPILDDITVYSDYSVIPKTETIIVTAPFSFGEIKYNLEKLGRIGNIVSISEVLSEITNG